MHAAAVRPMAWRVVPARCLLKEQPCKLAHTPRQRQLCCHTGPGPAPRPPAHASARSARCRARATRRRLPRRRPACGAAGTARLSSAASTPPSRLEQVQLSMSGAAWFEVAEQQGGGARVATAPPSVAPPADQDHPPLLCGPPLQPEQVAVSSKADSAQCLGLRGGRSGGEEESWATKRHAEAQWPTQAAMALCFRQRAARAKAC